MFTLKAYINEREIARIDVQNVGIPEQYANTKTTPKFEYKLRRVNGEEYGDSSILHTRAKGWKVLAVKVLQHLIEDDDARPRSQPRGSR